MPHGQEELGDKKPYNRLPCSCFLSHNCVTKKHNGKGFLIDSVLTFLNLGLYRQGAYGPFPTCEISSTKGASTAKALVIQHFECDEAIGCLDYDIFLCF